MMCWTSRLTGFARLEYRQSAWRRFKSVAKTRAREAARHNCERHRALCTKAVVKHSSDAVDAAASVVACSCGSKRASFKVGTCEPQLDEKKAGRVCNLNTFAPISHARQQRSTVCASMPDAAARAAERFGHAGKNFLVTGGSEGAVPDASHVRPPPFCYAFCRRRRNCVDGCRHWAGAH